MGSIRTGPEQDIVPPDESKVIPVMSSVERVWMEPYIVQGGLVFFKKYCPKLFVFEGVPAGTWMEA